MQAAQKEIQRLRKEARDLDAAAGVVQGGIRGREGRQLVAIGKQYDASASSIQAGLRGAEDRRLLRDPSLLAEYDAECGSGSDEYDKSEATIDHGKRKESATRIQASVVGHETRQQATIDKHRTPRGMIEEMEEETKILRNRVEELERMVSDGEREVARVATSAMDSYCGNGGGSPYGTGLQTSLYEKDLAIEQLRREVSNLRRDGNRSPSVGTPSQGGVEGDLESQLSIQIESAIEAQAQLDISKEQIDQLTRRLSSQQEYLQEAEAQRDLALEEAAAARHALESAATGESAVSSSASSAKTDVVRLRTKLLKTEASLDEARREIESLKATIPRQQGRNTVAHGSASDEVDAIVSQQEVSKARQEAGRLELRLSSLEEQIYEKDVLIAELLQRVPPGTTKAVESLDAAASVIQGFFRGTEDRRVIKDRRKYHGTMGHHDFGDETTDDDEEEEDSIRPVTRTAGIRTMAKPATTTAGTKGPAPMGFPTGAAPTARERIAARRAARRGAATKADGNAKVTANADLAAKVSAAKLEPAVFDDAFAGALRARDRAQRKRRGSTASSRGSNASTKGR